MIDQFKYQPFMFGIFQALVLICYITASHLVKHVMEWIGIEKMIRVGLCISFCGATLALISAVIFPLYLSVMIFSLMIFSFGSGLAFSPLNRFAIESSDEPMGARMAILSMFISGFATLATLLVNVFYNGTLLSLAILLFTVMVLSVVFNNLRRYQTEPRPVAVR